MYLPELQTEVSQGDIFRDIHYRFIIQDNQNSEPRMSSRTLNAMLLTYDCEYDKPQSGFVYVGEIRPLSEISLQTRGNVRNFKVMNAFPLQTNELLNEESYIDFRRILRFDKNMISEYSLNKHRILLLTEDARLALQLHVAMFFGFRRNDP